MILKNCDYTLLRFNETNSQFTKQNVAYFGNIQTIIQLLR